MRWDTKNQCWEYVPKEEETNLQMEVEFKEKEVKEEKTTLKQKIKRKLGIGNKR